MVGWVTEEEAKTQREADAREKEHAEALKREIENASKGTLEQIEARRQAYEAERRDIVDDQLPIARVRAERNTVGHAPEVERLNRRLRDLAEIIGALGRKYATLLEESRAERARQWRTAAETRRLHAEYIAAEARGLEHVAAIAEEWDAMTQVGGARGPAIPIDKIGLPVPPRMDQLRAFEAYVATLRRCGMRVDTSDLPPAIRARLDRAK
ncbi:MAG: hypothetical protein R3B59_01255 [Dehalococcoidia bacterium]